MALAATPASLRRTLRDLSEIVIDAQSHDEFARAALELVARDLSMDAGAINRSPTGSDVSVHAVGLSGERLQDSLLEYLEEMTVDDFRVAMGEPAVSHDRIFSDARRSALRLYTEYLVPGNVHGFLCSLWINRHGAFWMVMSRAGRRARYSEEDLTRLEAVRAVVAVGEALHARRPAPADADPAAREAWARDRRLTRAEMQVAELVERGLTNEGIGLVLGRSKNTVRNQLAAAFAKLRVSSRGELASALREAGARPRPVPARRNHLATFIASKSS